MYRSVGSLKLSEGCTEVFYCIPGSAFKEITYLLSQSVRTTVLKVHVEKCFFLQNAINFKIHNYNKIIYNL